MRDKTQILLEQAYQKVLESSIGPVQEESPEGEAILGAMTGDTEVRTKAANAVIGKYVTIYKRVRSQQFANKSDLPDSEIKAGERLHSTSEVTGAIPIASGIVKDVLWQDAVNPIRLVLAMDPPAGKDTEDNKERAVIKPVNFDIGNFLVVRKPFVRGTQQAVAGRAMNRPGMY